MKQLTVRKVEAINQPGMYGDGFGLYLNVTKGGTKSWILRCTVKGQKARREIGLGSIRDLSLADARLKAQELRAIARLGKNPIEHRDAQTLTFEDVALAFHKSIEPRFRNEKHAKQWISTLKTYAFPYIGERPIADIERPEVMKVLSAIWLDKHETASRVKQRMEATFDHAIAAGHREAANPVDKALSRALPRVSRRPVHHAALPWREVPGLFQELSQRDAISATCLQFIILTAARSGEARMASWDEIDFDDRVWRIPPGRMKAGVEHKVPLSEPTIEILKSVRDLDTRLVFPSTKRGVPLSVNAFRPLFRRMGRKGLTVHGFRSSFRDWAAEAAHADRTVAEAALAHRVTGVEGAYFRSDLLERRRALMEKWGQHLVQTSTASVGLRGS